MRCLDLILIAVISRLLGQNCIILITTKLSIKIGLVRELNPGPLAPEARIIPLDQQACPFHIKHFEGG